MAGRSPILSMGGSGLNPLRVCSKFNLACAAPENKARNLRELSQMDSRQGDCEPTCHRHRHRHSHSNGHCHLPLAYWPTFFETWACFNFLILGECYHSLLCSFSLNCILCRTKGGDPAVAVSQSNLQLLPHFRAAFGHPFASLSPPLCPFLLARCERLHSWRHPSDVLMIFLVCIFCVCNFPALNCFCVLLQCFIFLVFHFIQFIFLLVSRRVLVVLPFA